MFNEIARLIGNYVIIGSYNEIFRGKLAKISADEKSIVLENARISTVNGSSHYGEALTKSFKNFKDKGINIPEICLSLSQIGFFYLDSSQDDQLPSTLQPKKKSSNWVADLNQQVNVPHPPPLMQLDFAPVEEMDIDQIIINDQQNDI